MIYRLPQNTAIQVTQLGSNFEAVFLWNDGELNSKDDYEIPMLGEAPTESEAIGNLIDVYSRMNTKTTL